jgi:hypothetical protein
LVSFFGQCLVSKAPEDKPEVREPGGAADEVNAASPPSFGGKGSLAKELPRPLQAGLEQIAQAAKSEGATGKSNPSDAKAQGSAQTLSANRPPQPKAADQTDDLLFPTEEELRGLKGGRSPGPSAQPEKAVGKADAARAKSDSAPSPDAFAKGQPKASADADAGPGRPQTAPVPAVRLEGDVDAESWAEYGGWYRQDYAIFYRPTGHKDKLIQSWLLLTGPRAPKGDNSPAAAVFDHLAGKDAQGSCTKCHSVDDVPGKGRFVNFSPVSVASKQGRFTNFIHEPHFGILENRGCLTCHDLEKGRPYLKSYEQGNPQSFVSNFGAVKKDLCHTCHKSGMARQDCLLCHKYHVNGATTPIMSTRIQAR